MSISNGQLHCLFPGVAFDVKHAIINISDWQKQLQNLLMIQYHDPKYAGVHCTCSVVDNITKLEIVEL
jgi:hypothetical protein